MNIGVPKEVKNHEYRVGLTPEGVRQLSAHGHSIVVEKHCGIAIGYSDNDYQAAGATVVADAASVYAQAELIIKVKEPQTHEYAHLNSSHCVFTYLHLAPDTVLTQHLLDSGCIAIAYETVSEDGKQLPLLAPMSEVAGKLATQVGAHYLQTSQGGRGVLLGGITGVTPANVLVLGGGVVGSNAVNVAVGLGANVSLVDQMDEVLERQKALYPDIHTINSKNQSIDAAVAEADLIVGAVLVAGGSAPKVVSEAMIKTMSPGSVIVDVAIDQGGCIATSKPTTHDDPIFKKHGVTHYCVGNMPSSAAWTATQALSKATLPYILQLADKGITRALEESQALRRGLNIYQGKLCYKAVADAQDREWQPFASIVE